MQPLPCELLIFMYLILEFKKCIQYKRYIFSTETFSGCLFVGFPRWCYLWRDNNVICLTIYLGS